MVPEGGLARLTDSRDARPITAVCAVFVLAMMAGTIAQAGRVSAWPHLLLVDGLVLVLLALVWAAPARGGVTAFVSLWFPFLLTTIYYAQLGEIGVQAARFQDAAVQGWEALVFGGPLSMTWHQRAPSVALAWVLQSCYAAHYLIFPGVPVWLFWRRGREAAGRAIFSIALAFFSCYLIYLAFPVAGPLLAYPWPSGPVVTVPPGRLVYALNAAGASWGTAFPSSHVAASWCAVLVAWRDARRLSVALMPVALGLAFGTVYGQFHYAVDAVAGAGMALLAVAVSDPLRSWLTGRFAVSRS